MGATTMMGTTVGEAAIATELAASESEIGEMERRVEIAEDRAAECAREAGRLHAQLDESRSELAAWRAKGEEHPNMLIALSDLATNLYTQRKYAEAEPLILFYGDCYSPSIMSVVSKGSQMPPVLNAIGVQAAVFGNRV